METNVAPAQDVSGIIKKLDELLRHVGKPQLPLDKTFWDSSDCSDYLKVHPVHFTNRIASRPDFPQVHEIPAKRWRASEVIEWLEKQRRRKCR